MRVALLLSSWLAGLSALAQLWCAPNAVWTYRYQDWGDGSQVNYLVEHSYVGDTLYEGMAAHRIHHISAGTAFGQEVNAEWNSYEAVMGDVVWTWVTDQFDGEPGWDTLYWFGAAIGDRWWPPGHPETCPPYGMLEVVGSSTEVIDGVPLAVLHLDMIDQEGNLSGMDIRVKERIGAVPREPFILDCGIIIEYYNATFVCYSDDLITTPGSTPCGATLGFDPTVPLVSAIGIHPNPSTSGFTLTGLGSQQATWRILDMQGRVVSKGFHTGENRASIAEQLHPGSYQVDVLTDKGVRYVLPWVKE